MLIFALSASPTPAIAIESPLRDPSGLAYAKKESMVQVPSARVVLVDYPLLKKDFPELRGRSNAEIDQWLLDQTAFVSKPQAAQTVVNTQIPITSEERMAYRPVDYGRAAVFRAGSGLIDVKGVGSLSPAQAGHSNGLATLGESIREYAYEKLVAKIFSYSGSGFETVGTYGVIDLGFGVKHADGSTSPAGAILRQSSDRFESQGSLLDNDRSVKIEKVLRRYGITSAGAYHDQPFERINIQGTKKGAVIDFGGFLSLEKFDKFAINFYGSGILLDPHAPDFVQPDPADRVPFEKWGHTLSGKIDPMYDNPWIRSHELAEALRSGKATRADIEGYVKSLLDPVDLRLSAAQGCEKEFIPLAPPGL